MLIYWILVQYFAFNVFFSLSSSPVSSFQHWGKFFTLVMLIYWILGQYLAFNVFFAPVQAQRIVFSTFACSQGKFSTLVMLMY